MNLPEFIVQNAPYHTMDHPKSVHKGLTGIPQREITLTEHVIVAADHAYFITVFELYWQCKCIQGTAYLLQSKTDIWSYPADTMKPCGDNALPFSRQTYEI